MDGIKIEVTGNIARIIERPARITAGTVGLPVEFSFDNQWEGLSKTAVFKAGCTEKIVENLEAETAVPWEVTANPNVWLSIGVYGVNADGSVAIPTIWANVCVICEGVNPEGDVSTAPTLPVWQRLWNSIGNLLGLTTNAKGNLVEAINEVNNIALAGGIESDATLTKSGKAADAKATGDAIKSLTAEDVGAAPIPYSASGEVISVSDSGDAPLLGLKLYGKTTQNGTPTPASPVPLESAGESGAICVTVKGKNLCPPVKAGAYNGNNGAFLPQYANDRCTEKIRIVKGQSYTHSNNLGTLPNNIFLWDADGTYIGKASKANTYVSEYDGYIAFEYGETDVQWVQLEFGNTATAYEPYKGQTLTASTPNGLDRIDSVRDEVNLASVRVQRIETKVYTGEESFSYNTRGNNAISIITKEEQTDRVFTHVISSHFKTAQSSSDPIHYGDCVSCRTGNDGLCFSLSHDMGADIDNYTQAEIVAMFRDFFVSQYANGTPVTVKYVMATPIETPLSAEELAAYAALHSNKPTTTVFNDGGADMEIRYCTPNTAVPMNFGGKAGNLLELDEHGCVVSAPKSSMPFAPAGYGLGGQGVSIQDCNIYNTGFYKFDADAANRPFDYGTMIVSGRYDGNGNQIAMCHDGGEKGTVAFRQYGATVNEPWDYLNPAMAIGVEYRTTERYNGLPVYTKLVDFGAVPNSTYKGVDVRNAGETKSVRIFGVRGIASIQEYGTVSLPYSDGKNSVHCYGDNHRIILVTDSERATWTALMQVWYYKE